MNPWQLLTRTFSGYGEAEPIYDLVVGDDVCNIFALVLNFTIHGIITKYVILENPIPDFGWPFVRCILVTFRASLTNGCVILCTQEGTDNNCCTFF